MDQQYCVAATDKITGKREAISGGVTFQAAELWKNASMNNRTTRKFYKYFHVAKYPYKPRESGSR